MEFNHPEPYASELHPTDLVDIQLEDSFRNSQIIKQKPSDYSHFSSGTHSDLVKDFSQMKVLNVENQVANSGREIKFNTIRHYAKIVKTMSVIDLLLMLLFLIGGVFYLVILMPLPIAGYLAGYKLNRNCCIGYMVFLVCIVAIRIAFIVVIGRLIYTLVQTAIILMELGVLRFVFVFYKMLGILSQQERQELLIVQHSISA